MENDRPRQSRDRPGQRFHDLVATLERMFADRAEVSVSSSTRLRDKDTGRLREHDVVIVRHTHHGASLTAIECRDQGRKVGVPQIEAFAKKCERTGIHHGIMVSASGFTTTARSKARALNLTCMTLAEAEGLDWIGNVTIVFQVSNIRSIDAVVHLVDEGARPSRPVLLLKADGGPFEDETIRTAIMDNLSDEQRRSRESVVAEGAVTMPLDGHQMVDADGRRFPVRAVTFRYVIDLEVRERAMTLHHYLGDGTALEIASGQIEHAGGRSAIALVKSGEGLMGHVMSTVGSEHRVRVGDLPERRLEAKQVASGTR